MSSTHPHGPEAHVCIKILRRLLCYGFADLTNVPHLDVCRVSFVLLSAVRLHVASEMHVESPCLRFALTWKIAQVSSRCYA